MHSIHVDRERMLVDVRIGGLVTPEDVAWIGEEVRAAVRSLGSDIGRHRTLYDASRLSVAPAETIEMVKLTLVHPEVRLLWAKKVAILTGSALGRMQLQRLREARSDIALFKDRDAAIAWLVE